MIARYRIEPFAGHDRDGFTCGDADLDRYLREQISQDVRRRAATAFVAVHADGGALAGFYTLSAAGVDREDLPGAVSAKAPRYPRIPAVLLGRLAVDVGHHGRGLGGALLADALSRTLASGVGVHLMIVQPKNDAARSFYARFGFETLAGSPEMMFLPIQTAVALWRP